MRDQHPARDVDGEGVENRQDVSQHFKADGTPVPSERCDVDSENAAGEACRCGRHPHEHADDKTEADRQVLRVNHKQVGSEAEREDQQQISEDATASERHNCAA
jgi:hypothetical protein